MKRSADSAGSGELGPDLLRSERGHTDVGDSHLLFAGEVQGCLLALEIAECGVGLCFKEASDDRDLLLRVLGGRGEGGEGRGGSNRGFAGKVGGELEELVKGPVTAPT